MSFSDSFQAMERHVTRVMGVGSRTENPDKTITFNGVVLKGATLTPISLSDPYLPSPGGGYTDTPTCTIAIKKADFVKYGQDTVSRNRFLVTDESGATPLRVLKRGLDALSGEVQLYCGSVD